MRRLAFVGIANSRVIGPTAHRGPYHDLSRSSIRTPYCLGVAGETASYLDLEDSLGAHLPAALAIVTC
jgi:hypothetical protein